MEKLEAGEGLKRILALAPELADEAKRPEILKQIEAIVDEVGRTFSLVVPQPDGVPATMTFRPSWLRAIDPIPEGEGNMHTPTRIIPKEVGESVL